MNMLAAAGTTVAGTTMPVRIGDGASFAPFNDRVLVRVKEAPDKVGSIVMPEAFKDRMRAARGVVVAVGPGALLEDGTRTQILLFDEVEDCVRPLRPGDIVQFSLYAGQRMDDPDETEKELLIFKFNDLHGVWAVDDVTA